MGIRRPCAAAVAALVLAAGSVSAAPAGEAGGVEPAAAAAVSAALARVAGAGSFGFTAELASDAPLGTGEMIQFSGRLQVTVRRPDGLRVVFDGEPRSTRSWYDGRTFTHFDPDGNAYATCEAPPTLDALFPLMREQLGFTPPLSMLLHEGVEREFLAGVRTGYLVGTAPVGGVDTDHYAFRGDGVDLQVWVERGDAPLIRRMVMTRPDDPGAPQLTASFTDWDFGASLGASDFAFSPPAGAVLCEFLAPGE